MTDLQIFALFIEPLLIAILAILYVLITKWIDKNFD